MRPSLLLLALAFAVAGGTKPISTAELGGAGRLLAHVTTDKPVYKVGETVFVRSVLLEARGHKPMLANVPSRFEIRGPKGDVVHTGMATSADAATGFSWEVPEGSGGGEYEVVVHGQNGVVPAASRKFDVRVYRAPRLKTQIVFARDGYGPGDTLTATLDVTRAEGGAPAGARVTIAATIDGAEVHRSQGTVSASGKLTASFRLPRAIERGEGTLAFTVEDGGVVETATKTIPLLVSAVDIAVFPEGGDLVAGLPSRVYLEARTPAGKPADVAGVVVDSRGAEVARFRTEHEGRGRFTFTPRKGERYALRLTEPSGVKTKAVLPEVTAGGATISALDEVTPAGKPVRLSVAFTGDRIVTVVLTRHEEVLSKTTVNAGHQRGATVSLNAKDADGILIATVIDASGRPLAERLVFRAPASPLKLELSADRPRAAPGAPIALTVKASRNGKPVQAVVGLTVTDDSVLELIEKREQVPSLPVMVLLESDVRELADASVYLDESNPKSKPAVDLLLGTQGWRRFALYNAADFTAKFDDAARRALAYASPPEPQPEDDFDDFGGGGGEDMPMGGAPMDRLEKRPAVRAPPRLMPRRPAPPPVAAPKPVEAQNRVAAQELAKVPARDARLEEKRANVDVGGRGRRADKREAFAAEAEEAPFRSRSQLAWVSVREYAHQVRPNRKATDRFDFTETLYWAAGVKTNANGVATVRFALSDAVTSFKASAGGYGLDGALGAAELTLESVQPFYLEPKLPLEVTTGDVVSLPIAFVNGTNEPLKHVTLGLQVKGDVRFEAPHAFSLAADTRARKVVDLTIGAGSTSADLTLTGTAGGYVDNVTRQLTVKPSGFPGDVSFGGQLTANGTVQHTVTLPPDVVRGSVHTEVAVYPSPLANLTASLKRLIQEPSGCFEQTSSTTYPMTMALQYFQSHSGVEASLIADAKDKLDRGYTRLVGYECKQKGYEWFGEDPGHEALTAYGLLHFTDMSKVRSVDATMLSNTRGWMMKQRDGHGGFDRKRRALHTWVEDKDSSDAYITWALLSAGEKELGKEVQRVKASGASSANTYVTALAANVAQLSGDNETAKALMAKLAKAQKSDGVVGGATQSIVGSTGEALDIEVTSLSVLAWLSDPAFRGNAEKSMKFLAASCDGGRYGSTQSTVLALKAIVAYDAATAKSRAPGSVRLLVDGKPVGAAVKFDGNTQGAVVLPDVSELLASGTHTLALAQTGGGAIPYALSVRYHRRQPESSSQTPVALNVSLGKSQATEGDVVVATATVTNSGDKQLPTVVAIVGLPGGLEPRHDQLKELVKQGTIDAYEVMGRDVVLYWRGMTPRQVRRVPLSLVAAVPGRYTGPASRAYLYYGDEHKQWTPGLVVAIAPKR